MRPDLAFVLDPELSSYRAKAGWSKIARVAEQVMRNETLSLLVPVNSPDMNHGGNEHHDKYGQVQNMPP